MKLAEVINIQGVQLVKLPEEFRLPAQRVAVRKEGDAVILEPMKPAAWPPGFFDAIRIDDPAFVRPDQGGAPLPCDEGATKGKSNHG